MRTVAALYVDPRGPYPKMPGVECWDEQRDARLYAGPHPVVAHPPCGPWGRLKNRCKNQSATLAPAAVDQVRRFGGVLEHPADSKLWSHCGLPKPYEFFGDLHGFTIAVEQSDWGHKCAKPTWLYLVGISVIDVKSLMVRTKRPGNITHGIWYGSFERSGHAGPKLIAASKEIRRRTPPAFAEFLVELARNSRKDPMTHPKNTLAQRPELDGDAPSTTGVYSHHTPDEIADLDLIAEKLAAELKARGIRKRVNRGDAIRTAIKFYRENAPLVLVKAEG